jgi:hypothetical protein
LKRASIVDGNTLLDTITRLLPVATLLGFESATYMSALKYRVDYSLEPTDAIVFASIVSDLITRTKAEPKYFLSRDQRAFSNLALRAELKVHNCDFFAHFGDALDRLLSRKEP